jgi:hypothetical protein
MASSTGLMQGTPEKPKTTPEKAKTAAESRDESWSCCLRKKRKTGDDFLDERATAQHFLWTQIMEAIDENPDDLQLLFAHSQKQRGKRALKTVAHADVGDCFQKFGAITTLDEQVIINWVVAKSDLDEDEILEAKTHNGPKLAYELWSAGTQTSLSWDLPKVLRNITLFLRYSDERYEATDKRIENIKKNGGLKDDGSIDFGMTTFCLEFNDTTDMLESMTHCSTQEKATLPKGHGLSRDYDFTSWWNDVDAEIRLKPMPGVKAMSFFNVSAKKECPFGYQVVNNKKGNSIMEFIRKL